LFQIETFNLKVITNIRDHHRYRFLEESFKLNYLYKLIIKELKLDTFLNKLGTLSQILFIVNILLKRSLGLPILDLLFGVETVIKFNTFQTGRQIESMTHTL